MTDDSQPRSEIDAFFARQQREIMVRVAAAVQTEPFFQRQAAELRVRIAETARPERWRRVALSAAAAVLLCLIGLGAWRASLPAPGETELADAWLSAWPIPGVEDVGSDPLDAFGVWEPEPSDGGEGEPMLFENPLLPPSGEFDQVSGIRVRHRESIALRRV